MKKPTTTHPTPTVFAIYAEDKKGLIGQLLIYFNRRSYDVLSLNVARTDISDMVMVTLEAMVPEDALRPFAEKLKNIVEVYTLKIFRGDEGLKKTGFYRLNVGALNNTLWQLMGKYGAHLSSLGESSLVISKTGSDQDLELLYNQLDGPDLLGFCKSGLIMEESLNWADAS